MSGLLQRRMAGCRECDRLVDFVFEINRSDSRAACARKAISELSSLGWTQVRESGLDDRLINGLSGICENHP